MSKIVSIAVVFSITNGVATAAWAGKDVIKISAATPYNDPTIIATNIVEECTQLGGKLANSREVFRWQTDEFEVRLTREERLEYGASLKMAVVSNKRRPNLSLRRQK